MASNKKEARAASALRENVRENDVDGSAAVRLRDGAKKNDRVWRDPCVAYLDDGVQELLGLAARLGDVVAFGVRVVVGVVRAFASVPLRMGVSGQGRTRRSGFGVPEAGRNATNREKRGGRTCAA